jgi:hypothetical protein
MAKLNQQITHDGGIHNVTIKTDLGQAVITFGSSFTLRVDEENIDKLRSILYDATRELMLDRVESRLQTHAPTSDALGV